MSNTFSIIEVNMAAEPEVLITSWLQMIEIPFERQNVEYRARPYVRDIDRQRVTPVYAEYAKWRAITG